MAWWPWKKAKTVEKYAQAVDDRGWTRIFDWTAGAWQQHAPFDTEDSVLSYPTVFACITLIESDIAKLRPTVQRMQNTIWREDPGHKVTKLLKGPNNYQNHIQFKEAWINSKLIHGNTYVYKIRRFGEVDEWHILDPLKVTPLVADNGDVFYRLGEDHLTRLIEGQLVVPASEIIHDRFNCLYHPLVGLSPLFAAAVTATTGLATQKNSKNFFSNGSNPSGVLTAPGPISDNTAKRLKEYFQANFSGEKSGNVAIAGDGLKYEQMRMSSVDAQLIEQLGWTDEKICSVFHVPAYMVGVGPMPTHNNIEALTLQYYAQCLQILIESFEACVDVGLNIGENTRTQLDLDGLLRMDTGALIESLTKATGAGILAPDEARRKVNQPPVPGGKFPYLQQQNYSLEALAARDANEPFAKPEPAAPVDPTEQQMIDEAKYMAYRISQELLH